MNPDAETAPRALADEQALAPLLARLEAKPGFPALSESIVAINEITSAENPNIEALAATILKDFGLTASILRVANSAAYLGAKGSGILTVSRAVSVLGFSALRNIALTVMLFEQMKSRAQAREIKEAILHAYLAGSIAREAGKALMPRQAEEVYTCGLLHSLGQILALLYFPEEANKIRQLINERGQSEDAAALQVLGLDFCALGRGVAARWSFPAALVMSLRPLPAGAIERPQTPEDMLWALSGFGNEVCSCLVASAEQQPGDNLPALRERFAAVTQLSGAELHALVYRCLDDTKVFAGSMGVRLGQSAFFKQATAWVEADHDDEGSEAGDGEASEGSADPAPTPVAAAGLPRADAHELLSAAIHKLSDSILGDFVLNDILRLTIEALIEAMDFECVLLCSRDDKSGHMVARLSCGDESERVARRFRFPLEEAPNVFQLAISNGLDIVINDIDDPKIADKIPPWYRDAVAAKTFALMPLMLKGRAVALIYCDKQSANAIVIPERELSLMKTLRNQALLAIKQAGKV